MYQPNPSNRTSVFKWSKSVLKTEFTFSQSGCLTKAKESNQPFYLPIA